MRILWSRPALRDLEGLVQYIENDNPAAASRAAERIFDLAYSLIRFPDRGRMGRVTGTRELLVGGTPYILVYRLRSDGLEIVVVLHGARRWPDDFE